MARRSLTYCGITATDAHDRSHYPSLCFAYLAAYARQQMPEVRVIVARDAQEAVAARPDLVGFSASSVNIQTAVRQASRIKTKLGVPLMLGGVHLSALPHRLPPPFDLGVIGEGEQTFVELLQAFSDTGKLEPRSLKDIAGLAIRDEQEVVLTAPRAPIEDLSTIPLPDRSVLGGDWTQAHVVTSRGCPYTCRFCSSKKLWGALRTFPVETVLAEVDELVQKYQTREIHFFDDLFAADLSRLTAIADGLLERGYPGKIGFSCTVRAELATEAMFDQLRRLGVRRVTFGAESASPRILKWLKGAGASVEANQRMLDLAHGHGMICSPSFIKGSPGETGDDLLATYDFVLRGIRERKIDYFEVHCLTPFPGTAVWDLARERGVVSQEMDFDELRVPWERQYLNEAMPKTSFYFFENLTQVGLRWLGLNQKRLIGIVDVSHGSGELERLAKDLGENSILDEWRVIVFHGNVDPAALRQKGYRAGGPELLQADLADDGVERLFAYMRPEAGADAETLNRIIWWHFDQGADITLHGGFRQFSPATPFECSLAVGNLRGLQAGLTSFTGEPGAVQRLAEQGLKVVIYRPDDDPFAPRSPTARWFTEKLMLDFGINRPWKGRQRMLEAVEERIIADAAAIPRREARRRKIQRKINLLRESLRRLMKGEE